MDIGELLKDKSINSKQKTTQLSSWLRESKVSLNDLIAFAGASKDANKATCIEALEFVTKEKPEFLNKNAFDFVTASLNEKAPRVKWESARVLSNTVHLFPNHLDEAIAGLLQNSEHAGTVVRWSAALALGEILKLKTRHNKELLPALENIMNTEEKNSIKKIYIAAIKKTNA